jgi:hypothetical protein
MTGWVSLCPAFNFPQQKRWGKLFKEFVQFSMLERMSLLEFLLWKHQQLANMDSQSFLV